MTFRSVLSIFEKYEALLCAQKTPLTYFLQACFRFLATATMTAEDYRRRLLDDTSGTLYTTILAEALDDAETGIRYAACQGVRALSRSIEVLRTNVVDSGLGMKLWDLV